MSILLRQSFSRLSGACSRPPAVRVVRVAGTKGRYKAPRLLLTPNHQPYNYVLSGPNFSTSTIATNDSDATALETTTTKPEKPQHRWSREELEEETERLLSVLQNHSSDFKDENVKVDDLDKVFEAWSKIAAKDGMETADRAQELLQALEQYMSRLTADDTFMQWNVAWYNNVMHSYAVCSGGREAAKKAEAILDRMMAACRQYNGGRSSLAPPEPTSRSFNIAINAWSKSGEEDSGQRAENIFTKMEYWQLECHDRTDTNFSGATPNTRTLSGVIDAWAQSGAIGAEERAFQILMHAIDKKRASIKAQREGLPPVEGTVIEPNVILFNSTIHSWVNSKRDRVGAEKSEEILRMLERLDESGELGEGDKDDNDDNVGLKPNTRTLSLVIDAWAQCENNSEAAKRASKILNTMERLYREGHSVKPTYMAFTSCITAWSRNERNRHAAGEAQALFDRMLALYHDTGDKDFQPTVATGNAVISAWANSKHADSTERAMAVFEQLKEFCEPDIYSYNSLINAHAKRGEGLVAKLLLQQMEDACSSGRTVACPDLVTYNTVIYGLSKSSRVGSAEDAEALLEKMETMHKEGKSELKPNRTTHTAVITAWGRSNRPEQAENANKILTTMIDRFKAGDASLKPDVKAFTATLFACARSNPKYTDQRRTALKTAIQVFEKMKNSPEYDNPNAATYRAMMRSCNSLSTNPAERSRLLRSVFQQCCEDGMVDKLVLATLKEGVDRSEYASILGQDTRSYPVEWSRNLPQRDRPK